MSPDEVLPNANPQDAAAQPQTPGIGQLPPPQILPLAPTGKNSLQSWRARIKAAQDKLDPVIQAGKVNVQRYRGKVLKVVPTDDTVVVPLDFAYVEQKKATLFPRSPDVIVLEKQPQFATAAPIVQAVINEMMSPDEMYAARMMEEVLFDVLCPTGFAITKIGYESIVDGQKPVQVGMQPAPPDPMTGQPPIDPQTQQPQMVPKFETVPNIVYESYYWKRLSPARAIIPADFHGSDFNEADFLGWEYFEDADPDDASTRPIKQGGGELEVQHLLTDDDTKALSYALPSRRRCVELWYKGSRFDKTVKHPELIRQLIIKDGDDAPAVHRDSPYQRWQPDGTYIGMCGFPLHVLTLRYVADSAYPPSDCTMSRNQIDEVSRGRTQMIQQRKRSVPLRWVNINGMSPEDIDKITKGEVQGLIPLTAPGDSLIGQIAPAVFPRERFEFDKIAKDDAQSVWALQVRGTDENPDRTATEAGIKQTATTDRMEKERRRLYEQFYLGGVRKALALKQLFADDGGYVRIVGMDGVTRLQAWDRTHIQGQFAFSIKTDSMMRQDAADLRQQEANWINFSGKSPFINQQENWRQAAEVWGKDPSRLVTAPPPPHPPPANSSIQLRPQDFIGPTGPIAVELAKAVGIVISPQALQQSQTLEAQATALAAATGQLPGGSHGPAQPEQAAVEKMPMMGSHELRTGKMPGPGPM